MNSIRNWFSASWDSQLERMKANQLKNAKRFSAWHTRRHRRGLAPVLLLGVAVMTIGAVCLGNKNPWIFLGLWVGGFLIGTTARVLLHTLTGTMNIGISALLDEREREWRHRVTYIGFQVLCCLMLIPMLYTMAISNQPDAAMRGAMMMAATLVLGSTVPTIVLAWSLPDADREDLADEGAEGD